MEDTAMPDIMELLKTAGVEIAEDKLESFNTELRKSYKHVNEVEKTAAQHKTALDGLTEQLKTANAEIESYKGMDIEGIKKAADEYKAKAEKAEKDAAEKIADMQYDAALKDALAGEKFSSDYARQGIFADIKSKKLPIEGGAIMGLQDRLKALREAQPDAFAPEKTPPAVLPGITGTTPINSTPKEQALADAQAAMGIKLPKG